MTQRLARAAAFALTAPLLMAAAAPPPRAGVYSNVCREAETDDLVGAELTLSYVRGAPKVVIQTCEGGCFEQPVYAVKLSGRTLSFVGQEQLSDGQGHVVETLYHRFIARFSGNGVELTSPDKDYYSPGRLPYRPGRTGPSGRQMIAGRCR